MPETVQIPGGEAVLRTASEMRGRDRMLVKSAALAAAGALAKLLTDAQEPGPPGESEEDRAKRLIAATVEADLSMEDAMAMERVREAVAVARLVSWTLPEPLPTMDSIGDLPADLYDALIEVTGGTDAVAETDFGPAPSRESERPTGSSTDSVGHSTDAETEQTPTLPSVGVSTATASSTPG